MNYDYAFTVFSVGVKAVMATPYPMLCVLCSLFILMWLFQWFSLNQSCTQKNGKIKIRNNGEMLVKVHAIGSDNVLSYILQFVVVWQRTKSKAAPRNSNVNVCVCVCQLIGSPLCNIRAIYFGFISGSYRKIASRIAHRVCTVYFVEICMRSLFTYGWIPNSI